MLKKLLILITLVTFAEESAAMLKVRDKADGAATHHADQLLARKLNRALIEAIQKGDVEATTQALTARSQHFGTEAPLEIPLGDERLTPLLLAAQLGHRPIVELLLQHGALLEAQDAIGFTALHTAVSYNTMDVAAALLAAGANKEAQANMNRTPLHIAALMGHTDMVTALLRAGVAVDTADLEGMTALHMAVSKGYEESVEALLKRGAQVEARNQVQRTPLHLAAMQGSFSVISLLQQAGADARALDSQNKCPYQYWLVLGRSLAPLADTRIDESVAKFRSEESVADRKRGVAKLRAFVVGGFIGLLIGSGVVLWLKSDPAE